MFTKELADLLMLREIIKYQKYIPCSSRKENPIFFIIIMFYTFFKTFYKERGLSEIYSATYKWSELSNFSSKFY
jgi:hypothetical protein